MKTAKRKSPARSSASYVLLIVLVLGAISAVILGSAVTRTIHSATLNERNNKYTVNLCAAEAATEKVIARIMIDYQNGGESHVYDQLDRGVYQVMVPDENSYWEQFEFSNGEHDLDRTYVERISNTNYVQLESQFLGLYGWASTYRVLSNARQKTGRHTTVISAVQQDIQLASIPVFQFAFFYNGLLEFTSANDLTVNGRTHANGDILLTLMGPVTFNAPVTATGTIQKKDWGGFSFGGSGGDTTFGGVPDYRTNVAGLTFPIGTNNTSAALHGIIEIPPPGENADSPMGRERFYNKAGMVLVVSNLWDTNIIVTVGIKSSASDPAPAYLKWTNDAPYFMNYNILFFDPREMKTNKITQIDMSKLRTWMDANDDVAVKHPASNPLTILYVADFRTRTHTTNTAVRLVNGRVLPDNEGTGFTVATPNPLYVLGDYNVPLAGDRVPAALISDALTILSARWDDTNSNDAVGHRRATNTTVNAAILTGIVRSQGPTGEIPFSGAVMNLARLLEDWSGLVLTLNTSFVNLYESTMATGKFRFPDAYYLPPTRHFNFDSSFTNSNRLPPGTPMLSALIRAKWASPPPNTVNYAGE